jgi:hypothetical protein
MHNHDHIVLLANSLTATITMNADDTRTVRYSDAKTTFTVDIGVVLSATIIQQLYKVLSV